MVANQAVARLFFMCVFMCALVTFPVPCLALWPGTGAEVAVQPGQQNYGDAIADGSGGLILVWYDPGSPDVNIYAQRMDSGGNPVWDPAGVAVCESTGDQVWPVLVSDGAGGVICFWADYRGAGEVYAQRLDPDGNPLWTLGGERVSELGSSPVDMSATPDGSGGAIVVWDKTASGVNDIHAQKVNAAGTRQWTPEVVVCNAALTQGYPVTVSDGRGGAIVAWADGRFGVDDIFVQRINDLGVPQWVGNGVALVLHATDQNAPQIVSDGADGAIVVWQDGRSGGNDIYARRISAGGATQWGVNGNPVTAAANDQDSFGVDADGMGGMIVAWKDQRSGSERDIFAQRLNAAGNPLWTLDGIPICTVAEFQERASVVSDQAGGAVIVWDDWRNTLDLDIYGQRVDGAGTLLWDPDGVPVCALTGSTQGAGGVLTNGFGGALVPFLDNRNDAQDVYLQRLESRHGTWGRPDPLIWSARDIPNDEGGKVLVEWLASERDRLASSSVTHYSVWRAMDPIPAMAQGERPLVDPSSVVKDFQGPAYRFEPTAAGGFFWEWVGNQSAFNLPGYAYTTPTYFDSTAASPAHNFFQVISHDGDPSVYWISPPRDGYSVDNLAPLPPMGLVASRINLDVELVWVPSEVTAPDFSQYAIYRSVSPGVTPEPMYFLTHESDTFHIDTSADPTKSYFYVVTAADIHGNQSDPTNEASAGLVVGVGENDRGSPAFRVLSNVPNPFRNSTELRFTVPQETDVVLEVFTVNGRRVLRRTVPGVPAGERAVLLERRDRNGDRLPSGVYLYRLSALGRGLVGKLVMVE